MSDFFSAAWWWATATAFSVLVSALSVSSIVTTAAPGAFSDRSRSLSPTLSSASLLFAVPFVRTLSTCGAVGLWRSLILPYPSLSRLCFQGTWIIGRGWETCLHHSNRRALKAKHKTRHNVRFFTLSLSLSLRVGTRNETIRSFKPTMPRDGERAVGTLDNGLECQPWDTVRLETTRLFVERFLSIQLISDSWGKISWVTTPSKWRQKCQLCRPKLRPVICVNGYSCQVNKSQVSRKAGYITVRHGRVHTNLPNSVHGVITTNPGIYTWSVSPAFFPQLPFKCRWCRCVSEAN